MNRRRVRVAGAIPYVRLLSVPTTGQYTFDAATGEYEFAVADVAQPVFIDHRYTVVAGKSLSVKNLPMSDVPVFSG